LVSLYILLVADLALMGVYLKSTENRPDDHLFKHCYKWKDQQAVMWARVKEATKRGSRTARGRPTGG